MKHVPKKDWMTKWKNKVVALSSITLLGAAGTLLNRDAVLGQSAPTKDQAAENKINEKMIRSLIAELGNDSYERREAAAKRLAEIGEPALKPLENAAQKDSDPEVRSRARELMRVIDKSSLQEVRRFDGHAHDKYPIATRVAVSPDGKHIVTAGGRAAARTLCASSTCRAASSCNNLPDIADLSWAVSCWMAASRR
jgi:hypothetical protein